MGQPSWVSLTTNWPTYANGRPLRSDEAGLNVLLERIAALDVDALEDIVADLTGSDLAFYGEGVETLEDGLSPEESHARHTNLGAASLRSAIGEATRRLLTDDRLDLHFDGRRWKATSAGMSWGDDPSQTYSDLWLLNAADVSTTPVDAAAFDDDIMLAVATGVLDSLVDQALSVLGQADLTPAALDRVRAALDAQRHNLGATATHMRTLHEHFQDAHVRSVLSST